MIGWANSANLSEHFAFWAALETSKASEFGKFVAISLLIGKARSSILLEGLAFSAAFDTCQTSILSGVNPMGTPLAWDSSCTLAEARESSALCFMVHSRPSIGDLFFGWLRSSVRGDAAAFCAAEDTVVWTGLQGSYSEWNFLGCDSCSRRLFAAALRAAGLTFQTGEERPIV